MPATPKPVQRWDRVRYTPQCRNEVAQLQFIRMSRSLQADSLLPGKAAVKRANVC